MGYNIKYFFLNYYLARTGTLIVSVKLLYLDFTQAHQFTVMLYTHALRIHSNVITPSFKVHNYITLYNTKSQS